MTDIAVPGIDTLIRIFATFVVNLQELWYVFNIPILELPDYLDPIFNTDSWFSNVFNPLYLILETLSTGPLKDVTLLTLTIGGGLGIVVIINAVKWFIGIIT